MHFKSVYQKISFDLSFDICSWKRAENKKQLENRIERKQDENEETTSK